MGVPFFRYGSKFIGTVRWYLSNLSSFVQVDGSGQP
jgi:hypothetical protein